VHEVGAAAASLRQGVVDYLTKPFGRDRLRDAVVRGLEWHRSARDSRSWRERLEMEVEGRHRHLVDMVAGLGIDSDEGVEGMVALLTRGVPEASAHARRVSELASRIAHAMGLPAHDVATIGRGGLLHDLGKLAMPDALLRKPAPLTAEERAIIRRHPALGARLVAGLPFLHEAAAIVHDVQERPDGLGYPAGIRGRAVSIGARIVAAAEAYDTMIRARVFRDAISPADALLEMERCSGTQFDPEVVRVLETLVAAH
jgi:putative nucleotidyltransferase with HDIG domain